MAKNSPGHGLAAKSLTPTQMEQAVMNGFLVNKADGTQYRCYPKGYGLITGTPVSVEGDTYYLMALDQDGASAREKILELSGGEQLPKTVAFTSGRPGRCQYLFLIPKQYAQLLRTKKFPTGVTGDDGKGEQLELRWTGLQSCLPPSVHPTTGEYVWVTGCAPNEIQVAIAPLWILEAMLNEPSESQNSDQLLWQEVATDSTTSPTPRTYHQEQQWTDIDWALSYLTALSPCRADDYNEWCSVGMILKSMTILSSMNGTIGVVNPQNINRENARKNGNPLREMELALVPSRTGQNKMDGVHPSRVKLQEITEEILSTFNPNSL
jgi:hypothetical protein